MTHEAPVGIKLEHQLWVGNTHLRELIWGEAGRAREGEHKIPAKRVN